MYQHPRHFVAVDCVIFGYREGKLSILIYPRGFEPRKGSWSLPGGFVQDNESADDAANRVLKKITGLEEIFLKQVAIFSKPDREEIARVVSVAYYALIRIDQHDEQSVQDYGASWYPVEDVPPLIFDHDLMVRESLVKLQYRASSELIGEKLLPGMFTLTQLRNLYSAIFQREFDPGNFRKKILSLNKLDRTDKKDNSDSKKGSYYYKYKSSDNKPDMIKIVKI